jgi:poly-gamma-glutamate synthesis protein (capsule biosynthesis protein)
MEEFMSEEKKQPELSDHPAIVKMRETHFSKNWTRGDFTLAVGGDIIQSDPITQVDDPAVREILDSVKKSDLAFANMESNFGDYRNAARGIGGLQGRKEVAQDVKAMGFDMVARCSNHSSDQGTDEMLKGNKLLQEAGVVYAGSGINLEDARAPQFVETPKGRVGLVAMTMSFTGRVHYFSSSTASAGMEMAAYQSGNRNGLPGLNFLRTIPNIIVSKELFEGILKIKEEEKKYAKEMMELHKDDNTGGDGSLHSKSSTAKMFYGSKGADQNRQMILGQWYQVGDDRCGIHYDMNEDDLRLILRSVRQGKEWSDFMIASIHSHDYPNTLMNLDFMQRTPSDFIVELAHQCIDNGADVFVVTGPHMLRGIEIYRGKPIFYSLASFIYQLWGVPVGPDRYTDHRLDWFYSATTETEMNMDMWPPLSVTKHEDLTNMESMESAFAELRYKDGILKEIAVHPIEFGYDAPMSQHGIPRKPKPEVAERILKRIQRMSLPFGTKIEIQDQTGLIKL